MARSRRSADRVAGLLQKLNLDTSALGYFVRNAPFAVMSSALPGVVNYITILYLTVSSGPEAVGIFRLFMSVWALLGLISLMESSKVFVRAVSVDDLDSQNALILHRVFWSVGGLIVGGGIYLLYAALMNQSPNPDYLLLGLCAAIYYPSDFFVPMLQAKKRFATLFWSNAVKYGAGLGSIFLAHQMTDNFVHVVLLYLAVITAANVLFFLVFVRQSIDLGRMKALVLRMRVHPAPRESRLLSVALIIPTILDQADKFLIAAFFSVEVLGIYTLGYSTGRLLYNILKPSIFIFYRDFVKSLPSLGVIFLVVSRFTMVGLLIALTFYAAVTWIGPLAIFQDTAAVTMVVFLSYGIAMGNVVYSHAIMINAQARSEYTLYANLASGVTCAMIFLIAIQLPAALAMIVFATEFAVRHGTSLLTLRALTRSAKEESPA